jgi:hypothetical protein
MPVNLKCVLIVASLVMAGAASAADTKPQSAADADGRGLER